MARNVRTYEHFCVLARALERVGDRWSLLVIRDLLSGPKRFTDLMERLGGITPKTLTQRLRELSDAGIVDVDREPGRREVRYRLTPSGHELAPAVDALAWWGWRHAWRPPQASEHVHPEHLLLALSLVLDREASGPGGGGSRRPTRWHLRFVDDGEYTMEDDGRRWSVTSAPPTEPADVTVVGTTAGWRDLVRDPTPAGAEQAGLEITGSAAAVRRFRQLIGRFADLTLARA
jgi:DNA-binding HxlR family transcriptional regulator